MTWDPVRGRVLLTGGQDRTTTFTDTREFNGVLWTQLTPLTTPSKILGPVMAFDAARGRAVLTGMTASGNETWEWDGSTWTKRWSNTGYGVPDLAIAYDED